MDNTDKQLSRRQWLKGSALAGGVLSMGASAEALARACGLTTKQGEGPYYPEADLNRDNNLVETRPGLKPEGYVVYLRGRIQDPNCRPVEGAMIEIWQASARGRYNHTQDPNKHVPLDPNFQYWGRMTTGKSGVYLFKTIIPGHYAVGPSRFRPPHLHVKVHARGYYSLTTQTYFHPRSYDDPKLQRVVQKLNEAEGVPNELLVYYQGSSKLKQGEKVGMLNFTIRPNR